MRGVTHLAGPILSLESGSVCATATYHPGLTLTIRGSGDAADTIRVKESNDLTKCMRRVSKLLLVEVMSSMLFDGGLKSALGGGMPGTAQSTEFFHEPLQSEVNDDDAGLNICFSHDNSAARAAALHGGLS